MCGWGNPDTYGQEHHVKKTITLHHKVKNQRTEQALSKTSLTWNTNDAQLSNGGDKCSTTATTPVQRFVSPVLPGRPF
ncbi:hypothetical protein TNCV_4911401 [Trichonephila clavipes]|nr:hypothetical protein TNCV_4911401 [Trichonephila clavipes]